MAIIVALSLVIASLATVTSVKAAAVSFSGNISFFVPKPDGETTYGPSAVELINTTNSSASKIPTTTGIDILNEVAITKSGGDPNGVKCVQAQNSANQKCRITLEYQFSNVDLNDDDMYKVCIERSTSSCSIPRKGSEVASKYSNIMNIADPSEEDVATIVAAATGGGSVTAPKTCGGAVEGIGWIICPVVSAIVKLNDTMWKIVSSLLNVNPISQSTSIYTAWAAIRNIANVAFVIVFLIMIFSQLSSMGISNYGVKKLLPRLIIGAILVNISFFIVQISVDLANIIGSSLYNVLTGLSPNANIPTWEGTLATILGGTALAVGSVAIVSIGPAILMLSMVVVMGLLALLAAILTLIVRQAIIPILAIVAPLAFIAYLLPNTESWFGKWRSLLVQMLMLYPLAAVVFGGAQLAAILIINQGGWWNNIIGLVVMTLPLFSLPYLATKGGAITNAVGSRLQNMAKSFSKPLHDVVDPLVEEKKAERLAGSRGLMGFRTVRRKRGEDNKTYMNRERSELSTRNANGERNLAQRFNENVLGRAQNTENLKSEAKENWRERPLNSNLDKTSKSNQKAAEKTGQILNAAESLGVRKGAIDSQYEQKLNERIGTADSRDEFYDTRKRDSAFTSETLNKEADSRFKKRVNANVISTTGSGGLRDLSQRAFKANEGIKTSDLQTELANRRSGVADVDIQANKKAEYSINAIKSQDTSDFGQTILNDAELKASLVQDTGAKLQTRTNEGNINTFTETTGTLLIPRQEAIVAESQYKEAQGETSQLAAEITTEAGKDRLAQAATMAGLGGQAIIDAEAIAKASQEAKRGLDIANGATNSADRVSKQEFNAELATGGQLATDVAGIDTVYGVPRAQASGTAYIARARSENVAAAGTLFGEQGYSSDELVNVSLGLLRDKTTPASIEQQEAAAAEIVKRGYEPDITKLIDYAGSLVPRDVSGNVIRDVSGNVVPATGEAAQFQKALGNMLATSSGRPKYIPGSKLGDLQTATFTDDSDDLVVKTINDNKISRTTIASMSVEEMKKILGTIKSREGETNPARMINEDSKIELGTAILESFSDPRINSNLAANQIEQMHNIIDELNAHI